MLKLKQHVSLVRIASQIIDLGQSPISVSPSSPSFPSPSLSVNQRREVPSGPVSDTFGKASASSPGHDSNRGAKTAIFKEALGHLNASTETEHEAYRLAQLKISAQEVPNTKSSKSRVTVRV